MLHFFPKLDTAQHKRSDIKNPTQIKPKQQQNQQRNPQKITKTKQKQKNKATC